MPTAPTKPRDFMPLNANGADDVSQKHLMYTHHYDQMMLVNHIYNGVDDAVQYLFEFPQEQKDTFKDRQGRATLRNFVKRAVQAFTGMIFRKPIEVFGYGPKTTRLLKTIDTRRPIPLFTEDVCQAATKDGIAYILTDSPRVIENEDGSKTASGQPYMMLITRDQVINWRKDEYGRFTMVVIEETITEPYGKFGSRFVTQWRVYTQTPADNINEATVTIEIYRANNDNPSAKAGAAATATKPMGSGYYVAETIETEFNEIPLDEVYVDATPILYDIAKLNVKHFNRMSHKDRYLTMAALPIPVIWGADIDDQGNTTTAKPALVIGVDEAFIFSGSKEDSDFQWRELTGTSVELLENDLNAITEDITTGILRAAESANAVQKTATEVQLLQAEASNRVTAIATAVEIAMSSALERLSVINNEAIPETAAFIINKDFNASLMGSDGARVIMESYLLGMISMETYLQTLTDMELISITSAKDEIARIKADKFVPIPKTPEPLQGADKRTVGATNNAKKKPAATAKDSKGE